MNQPISYAKRNRYLGDSRSNLLLLLSILLTLIAVYDLFLLTRIAQ